MDLIHPDTETYAEKYSTAEDDLLKTIADYTNVHHRESRMLSGICKATC